MAATTFHWKVIYVNLNQERKYLSRVIFDSACAEILHIIITIRGATALTNLGRLSSLNQLILLMEKRCVFFAVRTELLIIIHMSFVFNSQASTTHHPNVFTPILSLSEGRAGIAWVPSNKMLFPPQT
jgi:hypothetical protein